jgi:hypothetical protein
MTSYTRHNIALSLSLSLSLISLSYLSLSLTHTQTHTHIYIYCHIRFKLSHMKIPSQIKLKSHTLSGKITLTYKLSYVDKHVSFSLSLLRTHTHLLSFSLSLSLTHTHISHCPMSKNTEVYLPSYLVGVHKVPPLKGVSYF